MTIKYSERIVTARPGVQRKVNAGDDPHGFNGRKPRDDLSRIDIVLKHLKILAEIAESNMV